MFKRDTGADETREKVKIYHVIGVGFIGKRWKRKRRRSISLDGIKGSVVMCIGGKNVLVEVMVNTGRCKCVELLSMGGARGRILGT